jgi:hypothetical protein
VFGDATDASELFADVVSVVSQGAACFSDHAYGDFLEHVFRNVVDVDFFGLCVGAYVRKSFLGFPEVCGGGDFYFDVEY